MSFGLKRGIVVGAGLALQILLLLFTYLFLGEHFLLIDTIYEILGFLLMLWLIKNSKSYSYVLPWIVIILIFPLVGTLLYLIIGRNKNNSKVLKRITESEKNLTKY